MNLKDLNLKDLVKIGIGVTAMLLLALTLNISIGNTTIINNYIKETEQNFEEQKQEIIATQEDIAQANITLKQVQSNVTKIKAVQAQELAIQKEILNEVD